MRPFEFARADDPQAAVRAYTVPAEYLAGGTTLLDLMKLDVMRPTRVIDINALRDASVAQIEVDTHGLRLGAMTRMADAAAHPEVRKNYPVIAQSLNLAASAQIRNMASLGGNVLQRTRCPYFRDTSYSECNKRNPGSGCAAFDGFNRQHAVLGVSDQCIAAYPGDFAQALIALDATIEIWGPDGSRRLNFSELHRLPGGTPHIETTLQPGELITAFEVPSTPFARRSLFVKIRDRESYEFALASAAVALDLRDNIVHEARVALGGVATVPWRSSEAETALKGKKLDQQSADAAAQLAFNKVEHREHNEFKITLGQRALARALLDAGALEIPA